MSENKHTQGPWEQNQSDCLQIQAVIAGYVVPVALAQKRTVGTETAKSNARRIVACVNACAGCATEVLETAPVGFFNSTYGHPKYLEEITKQRDELLAALERAEAAMEICSDWMSEIEMPDGWTTTTDEKLKISAAIVRVKGKQ